MPKLDKDEQGEITIDLGLISLWSAVDIMLSICCECGEVYGVKLGYNGNYGLSHGLCALCLAVEKEKLGRVK